VIVVGAARGRRQLPSFRLLAVWIALLALAQICDVITTGADMARGGVEGNALVGTLLGMGGLGLVFVLKLALVGAMAIVSLLVQFYAMRNPGRASQQAYHFVWRALQVSVVGLLVVAVHNTALLAVIND